MTVQMTVRIPDDLAQYIDDKVAAERAESRAAVVARAVRAMRDHERGLEDARIYATLEEDEDERSLSTWIAARTYPDLDA